MKIILALLVVLVAVLGFILVKKGLMSEPKKALTKDTNATLEEKLEILAAAGLKLSEPFDIEELLTSWNRQEYERPGYDMVLVGLGMTEERAPWRPRAVNLWHFDTECIEDHGDYKRIAARMAEMTQGALVLEDLQDHVDLEKGETWFSYSFQGKKQRVDCKVQDDWVDTRIFTKFVGLLQAAAPSKIYIYYDLGGQDCIIGCVTKEELQKLNGHGIKFVPLT